MPLPTVRLPVHPDPALDENPAKPVARLASPEDMPAFSPVHRLQSELARFEEAPVPLAITPPPPLYPGWFRLGFPLVASALLWVAILWGVGLIG
jgi:hypothetical protein